MKQILSISLVIFYVFVANIAIFAAEPAAEGASASGVNADAPNTKPRKLKIMSYNIFQGRKASMQRLADEINAQQPDFVALQEVDINTMREYAKECNGINFINELAQRTGMFGYFGRTIDCCSGYYGVAILSKHPATSVESIDLPNPKNVEPRIMLKGHFLLDGHTPIVFVSTHFDNGHPETRALQAQTVVDNLEGESVPAIVAGDLNSEPKTKPISILSDKGALLSGLAPTWPSDAPRMRIDYIFGFPGKAFTLNKTYEGTASKYAASDHLPVMSEVTVDL